MSELATISLGILITDWDYTKKDYLASYIPLITEAIKRIDGEILAEKNVQLALEDEFKILVPLDVIKTLLKRCARQGLIKRDELKYVKKPALMNETDFVTKRTIVLEAHNKLTQAFNDYAIREHNTTIDSTEAENVILTYLEKNQLSVLRATRRATVIPEILQKVDNSTRYIFGKYVQYIFGNGDKENARYIEILVQATMLANSVHLPAINQAPRKHWNTSLYFDTSFLIYALGYAGTIFQEPAEELLKLSYSTGAELYCFRHNLDEIENILRLCASLMETSKSAYGPIAISISHFIEMGHSHSYVEILAQKVEERLSALNIQIKDKPLISGEYDKAYQIDEELLEKYLRRSISYTNDRALHNDIASISAMHQYWKGNEGRIFEQAPSYFITTNEALVFSSTKFYKENNILKNSKSFPILTDHMLTNLMWLRQPTQMPDLPRKRIIADSYAATLPSKDLWDKYLDQIDSLVADGTVSEQDVILFKVTKEAENAIMEATLGEPSAISRGTVSDVIKQVTAKIVQEQISKTNAETIRANQAIKIAEETRQKEQLRKNTIITKSQKYARNIRKAMERLVLVLALISSILLFPWEWFMPNFVLDTASLNSTVRLIFAIVIFIFGVVYNVINMFWGTSLADLLQQAENKLASYTAHLWLQLAGFR